LVTVKTARLSTTVKCRPLDNGTAFQGNHSLTAVRCPVAATCASRKSHSSPTHRATLVFQRRQPPKIRPCFDVFAINTGGGGGCPVQFVSVSYVAAAAFFWRKPPARSMCTNRVEKCPRIVFNRVYGTKLRRPSIEKIYAVAD